MSWEHWIKVNKIMEDLDYDKLIEDTVKEFILDKKTRKMEQKDKVHMIILWWLKNKNKFIKYDNTIKIGKLLNVKHCTVVYYYTRRKKSRLFRTATEELIQYIKV